MLRADRWNIHLIWPICSLIIGTDNSEESVEMESVVNCLEPKKDSPLLETTTQLAVNAPQLSNLSFLQKLGQDKCNSMAWLLIVWVPGYCGRLRTKTILATTDVIP